MWSEKSDIPEILGDLPYDFKASVVAAELAGNGLSPEAFFFRNQSSFRRPVARDIEDIYWSNGEGRDNRLIFELNREGIYDMLPEAVIHQQGGRKKTGDATKLGNELRREERDARNFFSPLENEFHVRAFMLDMIERELLKNSNPSRNREFFHYFFEDSSLLSDRQLLVLLHIIPLCHKIRGDLELIGLSLSRILNYPVEAVLVHKRERLQLSEDGLGCLGDAALGVNLIVSDGCDALLATYEIRIRDVAAEDFASFGPGGNHRNVLEFILQYFLPAGTSYAVIPQCLSTEADLRAGGLETVTFLGFNSYI